MFSRSIIFAASQTLLLAKIWKLRYREHPKLLIWFFHFITLIQDVSLFLVWERKFLHCGTMPCVEAAMAGQSLSVAKLSNESAAVNQATDLYWSNKSSVIYCQIMTFQLSLRKLFLITLKKIYISFVLQSLRPQKNDFFYFQT